MATLANGAHTPSKHDHRAESHSPAASADRKRKRDEDASHDLAGSEHTQTQRDILDILRKYDTEPSFLGHAFDVRPKGQPSPKKAKLTDTGKKTATISAKLGDGSYATLRELRQDADMMGEQMLGAIRQKAQDREGTNAGRMTVDDLKRMQRVQTFVQAVATIVDQEDKYMSTHGIAQEVKVEDVPTPNDGSGSGTVLTLFGNAPTPRQLFSSRQGFATSVSPAVESQLPVDEMSLPMGMSATKIVAAQPEESKKGPTFEDAFPPPHNLQQQHPPKSHRRSTNRDDTIPWKFKDQTAHRNRKGGYTVQSLTVGDWLDYGGFDSKDDPSSSREKRKQRDRTLSGSESIQTQARNESAEEASIMEEEALFRRAYSSFAPSCDNSKSVVPEQVKNTMWWQKVGNKRFHEGFALDPALLDDPAGPSSDDLDLVDDWQPSDDFESVIDELDSFDDVAPVVPARSKTDIDNVLEDISKLLETLASHQRIRNASLPPSTSVSRTPISPAPFLASRVGKPDAPAEDEVATYNSLRRELAYLILRLPPYAVAKLDGNQLAELGVRKLIPFETTDVKGIMEEDQVARLAKHNALATAGSIASLTRPGSTSSQHYSSMNQRTPAIGQAANTRYGQGSYSVSRPSAQTQFQRSTSNQSSYGTPSSNAPRMGSYSQYSRPGALQMNGQQYYQRQGQPSNNYSSYSQQYGQGTPQTQQRPGYSQPLAQYTQSQAAARNAVAYQANQGSQQQQSHSPFNRTASPIKPSEGYQQSAQSRTSHYQNPAQYAQALQNSQQQQPGSGRNTPANYLSQPQTPVNGYPRPTPQPIAQAPHRGASGTPQPIAQAPSRAASGTPQPPAAQTAQQAQTNGAPNDDLVALQQHYDHIATASPDPDATGGSSAHGGRLLTCDLCGRVFDRPSSYTVHMRTHTGERPFACGLCGKEFAVRSNLNRHLKTTHSGEGYDGDDGEEREE